MNQPAPEKPPVVLELQGVRKSYLLPDGSRLPVLNIPHFTMLQGEQVVLMGRSGSGKSTLLHIISGIARPDAGKVIVDGVDITQLSEPARDLFRAERIGYVFQTFNLLAGFTALENVLLAMSFGRRRADEKRAVDLLTRVGLNHRLDHRPSALSVGEQQRVAVARALANRPKLLLADEPTASVDVGHQKQIIDLLRTTCEQEQVALLLVTHSPEVAEQFERIEELEELNQVETSSAAS